MRFAIPVHLHDLELDVEEDRYRVTTLISVASLPAAEQHALLDDVAADCTGVLDGDSSLSNTFDRLYCLVRDFAELPAEMQARLADLLSLTLGNVVAVARREAAEAEGEPAQAVDVVVTTWFKMLLYLLHCAVGTAEKLQARAAALKAGAKKSKKSDKDKDKWEKPRERALAAMTTALSLDMSTMWEMGVPDEEFVMIWCRTGLQLLESAAALRHKTVRAAALRLVAEPAHRFECAGPSVATSLMHMLSTHEHLPVALAELLLLLQTEFEGDTRLASELLREVGHLSRPRDSSGTKTVAAFVAEVAARMPQFVLAHVSLLLPHLDGESYMMRNGVVTAVAHIVARCEALDGKTRDALLDVLQARARDVNSYARANALRAWAQLAAADRVPLARVHAVAALALGRLRDKSVVARKAASGLLVTLLERNPFAPQLARAPFQAHVAELEEWLASLEVPGVGEGVLETVSEETDGDTEESESEDEEQEQEIEEVQETDVEAKTRQLHFCRAALAFVDQMEEAAGTQLAHLSSSTATDVLEALQFFERAAAFAVPGADAGVRKLLTLVWSSDESVRDAALRTFTHLFVFVPGSAGKDTQPASAIAKNLVALVRGASVAELTSLEEVVGTLMQTETLPREAMDAVWDAALGGRGATQRDALLVAAMVGYPGGDEAAKARMAKRLVAATLAHRDCDVVLVRSACLALQKLGAAEEDLGALVAFLRGDWAVPAEQQRLWFPAAEQALNALFALTPRPDLVAAAVARHMGAQLDSASASLSAFELARIFFTVGHLAVKLLVHSEAVASKVKKATDDEPHTNDDAQSDDDDDELQANSAAERDAHHEQLVADLAEQELVGSGLLGAFVPVIVRVVANEGGQFGSALLREAAVMALCKFMAVSSQLCERCLPLLFTTLGGEGESAEIRANIVIALGDLAFRFPNQLEPWTQHIHARLHDADVLVRKNTLMVLTHLILHDMVKLKGQVAEIALLLEDPEPAICSLARVFFHQLGKRGTNPIYNALPDTISRLSAPDAALSPEAFRRILKHLLTFVQKDRQTESLVEKICHRFAATTDELQWRNLAYCLACLNTTDKALRKYAELFRCYKPALALDDVMASFDAVVAKARKTTRPEAKEALDEWERMLDAAHSEGSAAEGASKRAARARRSGKQRTRAAAPAAPVRRSRRAAAP